MRKELCPELMGIEQERADEILSLVWVNQGKGYDLVNSLSDFDEAVFAAYLIGSNETVKIVNN